MNPGITEDFKNNLEAIAGILLRCFIITLLAMLFVWIMIVMLGDTFYAIHSQFINIP